MLGVPENNNEEAPEVGYILNLEPKAGGKAGGKAGDCTYQCKCMCKYNLSIHVVVKL